MMLNRVLNGTMSRQLLFWRGKSGWTFTRLVFAIVDRRLLRGSLPRPTTTISRTFAGSRHGSRKS